MLMLYSYLMKYQQTAETFVDMQEFYRMIDETDLFEGKKRDYVLSVYEKFTRLIPVLQQLKQYATQPPQR